MRGQPITKRVEIDGREIGALLVVDHFNDLRNVKQLLMSFLGAKETRRTGRKKRKAARRA